MNSYRKKPVVIEAIQITGDNDDELIAWLNKYAVPFQMIEDHTMIIQTLEGDHRADPGDWIIKGVINEFYPCKPDVFEATYEKIEDIDAR